MISAIFVSAPDNLVFSLVHAVATLGSVVVDGSSAKTSI
jgi:hypothetical protein